MNPSRFHIRAPMKREARLQGLRGAVTRADNLATFMLRMPKNSGTLNFLEPWDPVHSCKGIALEVIVSECQKGLGNIGWRFWQKCFILLCGYITQMLLRYNSLVGFNNNSNLLGSADHYRFGLICWSHKRQLFSWMEWKTLNEIK